MDAKRERLIELLREFDSVLVGYSGGVDSVFLAKIAVDTLGTVGSMPDVFGQWPKNPDTKVIVVEHFAPAASTSMSRRPGS